MFSQSNNFPLQVEEQQHPDQNLFHEIEQVSNTYTIENITPSIQLDNVISDTIFSDPFTLTIFHKQQPN